MIAGFGFQFNSSVNAKLEYPTPHLEMKAKSKVGKSGGCAQNIILDFPYCFPRRTGNQQPRHKVFFETDSIRPLYSSSQRGSLFGDGHF